MIGIVLVSHQHIAAEMLRVAEHIMGKQERIAIIGIHPEDVMEQRREEILKAAEHVDTGRGVIIVADMFGGTPCNLSISVMRSEAVEVIAGMNLPMLIKLMSVRNALPLKQAVEYAQIAGRKYINNARNLLQKAAESA